MKRSKIIRNNMMSLLVIFYGCMTVMPAYAAEGIKAKPTEEEREIERLQGNIALQEQELKELRALHPDIAAEQKAAKASYRKFLDSSKGIIVLSMGLAALGATLYLWQSESAREQLQNSTLSMYGGKVLGALGTVGSVVWNFGRGAAAGLTLPFALIPGPIGKGAANVFRFIIGDQYIRDDSRVLGFAVSLTTMLVGGYFSLLNALEYRTYTRDIGFVSYDPETIELMEKRYPELRAQRVQNVIARIHTLKQKAEKRLEMWVLPSDILEKSNWRTAEKFINELNNILKESWDLALKDSMHVHDVILAEALPPIERIKVLVLAFQLWHTSQTPGGWENNWDIILKTLISFLDNKINEVERNQQKSKEIAWENLDNWKEKYSVYFELASGLIQIQAAQTSIDQVLLLAKHQSQEIQKLQAGYKKLNEKYEKIKKEALDNVQHLQSIIKKKFNF